MNHECSNTGCTACSNTEQCKGCCGSGELVLCKEEVCILLALAQLAFLPIIQKLVNGQAQYFPVPDDEQSMPKNFSQLIMSLEQKRLISIDPDIPLKNASYGPLASDETVLCGSLALTARGQEVLKWLSSDM